MDSCCDPADYQSVFTDRFARRLAKRYGKRGLSAPAESIVGFLTDLGVTGASVLEIGGGVGEIQVELLRRGASSVTNLEISANYEEQAAALLEQSGMTGRVDRRMLDIARSPEQVEPADVVVLHRVVCCYPDYQRLLAAAASHARRVLVFSHPSDSWISRSVIAAENLLRRIRGIPFRAYVHSPAAMVAVAEDQGVTATYRHHTRGWQVVGLVREPSAQLSEPASS